MKKILIALAATVGLYSCTEKGPAIDFGNSISEFSDTTYNASIETPEVHRVLVEEFTGAACPNCPVAREQLAVKSDANPGRVIVLGLHVNGIPQSAPVHDIGVYDFRTTKGTDIMNGVFGSILGIPAAGIDRIPVDGSLSPNRTLWDAAIDSRLAVATPINLHLESSYDATAGKALIKVKMAYTQDVAYTHSLSLVVMEDGIVDAQEYPSYIDTFYTFKHVVRDYITSTSGINVLPAIPNKPAGTVYEAQFYYPVDAAWKPENCHVVAYVHRNDGSTKEVIQAAEAHLTE